MPWQRDYEGFATLLGALTAEHAAGSFALDDGGLKDADAIRIAQAIEHSQGQITSLSLKNSQITGFGAAAICTALAKRSDVLIEELSLESNPIDDRCIEAVCSLVAASPFLIRLSFRNTHITDRGFAQFCNFASRMSQRPVPLQLDVSRCSKLTPAISLFLADAKRFNKQLSVVVDGEEHGQQEPQDAWSQRVFEMADPEKYVTGPNVKVFVCGPDNADKGQLLRSLANLGVDRDGGWTASDMEQKTFVSTHNATLTRPDSSLAPVTFYQHHGDDPMALRACSLLHSSGPGLWCFGNECVFLVLVNLSDPEPERRAALDKWLAFLSGNMHTVREQAHRVCIVLTHRSEAMGNTHDVNIVKVQNPVGHTYEWVSEWGSSYVERERQKYFGTLDIGERVFIIDTTVVDPEMKLLHQALLDAHHRAATASLPIPSFVNALAARISPELRRNPILPEKAFLELLHKEMQLPKGADVVIPEQAEHVVIRLLQQLGELFWVKDVAVMDRMMALSTLPSRLCSIEQFPNPSHQDAIRAGRATEEALQSAFDDVPAAREHVGTIATLLQRLELIFQRGVDAVTGSTLWLVPSLLSPTLNDRLRPWRPHPDTNKVLGRRFATSRGRPIAPPRFATFQALLLQEYASCKVWARGAHFVHGCFVCQVHLADKEKWLDVWIHGPVAEHMAMWDLMGALREKIQRPQQPCRTDESGPLPKVPVRFVAIVNPGMEANAPAFSTRLIEKDIVGEQLLEPSPKTNNLQCRPIQQLHVGQQWADTMRETLRILVVRSGDDGMDLDEEDSVLWSAKLDSPHGHLVEIRSVGLPTAKQLQQHLAQFQPHCVHYCGHSGAGGLKLPGGRGGQRLAPELFDTDNLQSVLRDANVSLLVLNSCQSSTIARACINDVGFAVAVQGTVFQGQAVQFAKEFWSRFLCGTSFHQAFAQAKQCTEDTARECDDPTIPNYELIEPEAHSRR